MNAQLQAAGWMGGGRREACGRSGGAARPCSFADLVYLFQFDLGGGAGRLDSSVV